MSETAGFNIRLATLDDLRGLTEIYNHAIRETIATFDTEEKSAEEQYHWFSAHGPRHPILVASVEGAPETIAGWASLSQWMDRCAYQESAEDSVYVREGYQGKGIGRALLTQILVHAKVAGLHTILARVAMDPLLEPPFSLKLHEAMGFRKVGVMKEVGFKFDRWLDVILLQRMIC